MAELSCKRRMIQAPRNEDFVSRLRSQKSSGSCPKCRKYVDSDGVECLDCRTYWHFTCAEVTKDLLLSEWEGKDFKCVKHRLAEISNVNICIKVKVKSYTLNPQTTVKKLISNMNCKPKIEPKDRKQQFVIKLCPPTFEIIIANMIDFGDQWGIKIKGGNIDSNGTNVSSTFKMDLCTRSGMDAPISINCYNTTSSLLVQLNKAEKNLEGWAEKVDCLGNFVKDTLGSVIEKIEGSKEFDNLKQMMFIHLEKLKDKIADGHQIAPELFHQSTDTETTETQATSKCIANSSPCAASTPKSAKSPEREIAANGLLNQLRINSPIRDKDGDKTDKLHTSSGVTAEPEQSVMPKISDSEMPSIENVSALKSEIENLEAERKAQIAKKNKEINNLNGKVEKLKEDKSRLSSEMSEKEKERKCLETKVTAQKRELLAVRQEIKTLKEHQIVLQTTIDQQTSIISSQNLVIREQEIALESHFNLATSFMEEIEDNECEDEGEDDLLKTHEILNTPNMKKSTSKLKDVLIEQRMKIMSLEDEKKANFQEFKEKESGLLSDVTTAKNEMIDAHKETISLKNSLNDLEGTLLKLKADNKSSTSQLADTKSSLDFQTTLNTELKRKVDILQSEINDLKQEVETPKETEATLVKQLKQQLDEKVKDIQSINDFCEAAVNDAEKLKNEQRIWERENTKLSEEISKMNILAKDWEKEKKSLTDEIEIWNKRQRDWEKERKKMGKNLQEANKNSEELKKSIESSNLSRMAAEKELQTVYQLQDVKNLEKGRKEKADVEEVTNDNTQSRILNICLFELKEKGLCRRRNKCKFLHSISDAERGDVTFVKKVIEGHAERMNFCPVELVEKGCEPENCRFNHNRKYSTLRKRPHKNERGDAVAKQICFKEAEGKCPRGASCFYSHEIPEDQKKNPEFLRKIAMEKEQKQGLCVNEFMERGSCYKKQNCKFNHRISGEQRADTRLKERMLEKLKQLQDKQKVEGDDHKSQNKIAETIRSTISHQMEMLINKAVKEISMSRCF